VSKILIDVDGVTADMVRDLFERMGGTLKVEDFPTWDIFKQLSDEDREEAYSILSKSDFWANLPVVDGSQKGVRHLKNFGHEVVWVTSPWSGCPGWGDARTAWIKKHFGEGDEIHLRRDKENVDGDCLIDDKPDNVDTYKRVHPDATVLIFDTPHNKKYTGVPRFKWNDVGMLT